VQQQPTPPSGSRRRRLWELGSHAHCPVIGVCLPIAALRRITDKVHGGSTIATDYELHCGVIAECRQRSRLAEAVQKELDRRYAVPLQRAARCKDEEALGRWWTEAAAQDLGGSLWAALSHARCTEALEHRVLGEVHMLQHQVGMATRVELARFEALIDENAVLARQLAVVQQRSTRVAAEQAHRREALEAELVRLRGELIARDTTAAGLREQLQTLQQASPDLPERVALAADKRAQAERILALQRALLQAREEADRQRRRADEALAAAAPRAEPASADEAPPVSPTASTLGDRAVLCVGGRSASVPAYRQVIERTGGRFLHHDGGEEDKVAQLDATLAAADLVICQTGCVSHDAYWRVKDHCKRTGKRCLFVDNPSRAALERALQRALLRGTVPVALTTADDAQHERPPAS
jgi:hypothetical protein